MAGLLEELMASLGRSPPPPGFSSAPLSDPAEAGMGVGYVDPYATLDERPKAKPAFGAGASPLPFGGLLSETGLLNAPTPGVPDLPPSTNDPASGEPEVTVDGIPMPRPRPVSAGATPMTLAPKAETSELAARSVPAAPATGPLDGLARGFSKVFSPTNAPTLLALGAGFSGAPSFGEGMRRGFGGAAITAQKDRAFGFDAETMAATERALVTAGVPNALARAAARDPKLMGAIAPKYFETKPSVPHEIGTDRYGNKIMGMFNPNDNGGKGGFRDTSGNPIAAPGGGGTPGAGLNSGQPQDGGGESGQAFLDSLPDRKYADKIKAIAEGREPFPQGQIMRSPYGRRLGEDVLAFDPTFDAVNYKARETTRKDFTSGKSAQNLTAFNTAIQHLDTLDRSISGLNNSNWTDWNKIANNVVGRYDPKFQASQKAFSAARTAVADELTRAFRGSGGNVHDIIQWEKTINEADSPAALRSAVKQATELLRGRIDAVGDQYNRGMGTTKDPLELLNPKAAESFKRLHEQDPQRGPEPAHGAAPGVTSTGVRWSVQP